MPTRIFVSAASGEFGHLREEVARELIGRGIEPVFQEGWGLQSGALMSFLRKTIRSCDGVIHLTGYTFGRAVPSTVLTRGLTSFAQWEARLARRSGKPLYLLVHNVAGAIVQGSTDAERHAQTSHRNWCLHLHRINFTFDSDASLIQLVKTLTPALVKAGSRLSRFKRWLRTRAPFILIFALCLYASASLLGRWFLNDALAEEQKERPLVVDLHATKAVQILEWVPFLNRQPLHQALEKAASARVQTDNWAEALVYLERLERVLDAKDLLQIWVSHAKSRSHAGQGRVDEEAQALQRQLRLSREAGPPGSRMIVIALTDLSTNAVKRGQHKEALQLAQEAQKELAKRELAVSAATTAGSASQEMLKQWEDLEVRGRVANAHFELASSTFQKSGHRPAEAAELREECSRLLREADKEYTRAIDVFSKHIDATPQADHRDYAELGRTLTHAALVQDVAVRCEIARLQPGENVDFAPIFNMADKAIKLSIEAQQKSEGHLSPVDPLHGAHWLARSMTSASSAMAYQKAGRHDETLILLERAARYALAAHERWRALPLDSYLRVPEASHQCAVAFGTMADARFRHGYIQRAYLDYEAANEHAQAADRYVKDFLGGEHRDLAAFRAYAKPLQADLGHSLHAAQAARRLHDMHATQKLQQEVGRAIFEIRTLAECCRRMGMQGSQRYYLRQALVIAVHFAKVSPSLNRTRDSLHRDLVQSLEKAGIPLAEAHAEGRQILHGNEAPTFRLDGMLFNFVDPALKAVSNR